MDLPTILLITAIIIAATTVAMDYLDRWLD